MESGETEFGEGFVNVIFGSSLHGMIVVRCWGGWFFLWWCGGWWRRNISRGHTLQRIRKLGLWIIVLSPISEISAYCELEVEGVITEGFVLGRAYSDELKFDERELWSWELVEGVDVELRVGWGVRVISGVFMGMNWLEEIRRLEILIGFDAVWGREMDVEICIDVLICVHSRKMVSVGRGRVGDWWEKRKMDLMKLIWQEINIYIFKIGS